MVRDPKELQAGAITIPKNTTFNTESEDKTFSIAEVLDALNKDEKADPGLTSYIASINELVVNEKEQLKIKDKSMIANDGVSYLASQEDGLVKGLFDESDSIVGFSPSVESYDITVPGSDDADDKKEIMPSDKLLEDNKKAEIEGEPTEGNFIEIDYSDKKNVQPAQGGVYLNVDNKKKFIKSSQIEEYQNPTIKNEQDFFNELMDKENRPDFKKGFPKGSSLEVFLDLYNPKIKEKLKSKIYAMWLNLEQKNNKRANEIGQQIQQIIKNNKINYPKQN